MPQKKKGNKQMPRYGKPPRVTTVILNNFANKWNLVGINKEKIKHIPQKRKGYFKQGAVNRAMSLLSPSSNSKIVLMTEPEYIRITNKPKRRKSWFRYLGILRKFRPIKKIRRWSPKNYNGPKGIA